VASSYEVPELAHIKTVFESVLELIQTREDALVKCLDDWVTLLGDNRGDEVDWAVIDPLWRSTHDLLSELKTK